MLFRTNDAERWGTGVGRNLTASEVDGNFWELRVALNDLIANPGAPVEIVSITAAGNKLTFNMSDGSQIGPVYMPILQFHWRGDYVGGTSFEQLDVFRVKGVGLYSVLLNHDAPTVFNPALQIEGSDAYFTLFEFAPPENVSYDVGFYYPDLLTEFPAGTRYLYQEPLVRKILLPVVPANGAQHQAYMDVPAATHDQVLGVFFNDTNIGHVTIAAGENVGTVTITADQVIDVGERLSVGKPATSDSTASGLTVVFAAQQVVG